MLPPESAQTAPMLCWSSYLSVLSLSDYLLRTVYLASQHLEMDYRLPDAFFPGTGPFRVHFEF